MPPEFDVVLLAMTLWGEARGESFQGKLGVAYVICNRMKRGKIGTRVSEVVLKPFQFSFWNTEDPSRPQASHVDYFGDLFQSCLGAARSALDQDLPDPTGGAEYYMNVELVKKQRGGTLPKWWESDTDAQSQCQIGNHTFRKRK